LDLFDGSPRETINMFFYALIDVLWDRNMLDLSEMLICTS
jgi:hypothetical protein